MPSPASTRYAARRLDVARLVSAARRALNDDKRVVRHACLAAIVAAWESYIEDLLTEALAEIAGGATANQQRTAALLADLAATARKRFNTPNAENARELLAKHTGFDCLPSWVMPRRRMVGIAVRARLNEVVEVRHAFAHGFPMPTYSWNIGPRGPMLSLGTIRWVDAFIADLVARTDRGMADHLKSTFGVAIGW